VKIPYSASIITFGIALFSQLHAMQDQWARDFLSHYSFKGDELVLHLGCGNGNITHYISTLVSQNSVYGWDASRQAIADAKRKYPSRKFEWLSFSNQRPKDISVEGLYDIVFSCSLLQDFGHETHQDILKKISRSLVPGGKMLLVMMQKDLSEVFTCAEQLSNSEHWAPYFVNFAYTGLTFTMQAYERYLFDAGFEQFYFNKVVTKEKFKNRKALCAWISEQSEHVRHLKVEDQASFIDRLLAYILEKNPENEQQEIELNFSRIEVIAQK
jgi:trans-aconitate 2-methyltransferase